MKTRLIAVTGGAVAVAAAGSVAFVAASAPAAPTARPAAAHTAASRAMLQTHKTKLGTFLVDGQGRTLYLFEKDKNGKSACFGACAKAWPPSMTSGKPKAGKGVKASKIGTTKRAGGGTQATYAGHPLYRFFEDHRPGQTAGEGSKAFGAGWYVVAPSGKKIDND